MKQLKSIYLTVEWSRICDVFFFTISTLQLIFRIRTLLSLSYAQFYRLLSLVTFLCKTVKVLSSFEHCKRFTTVSDSPLHMSQNANFSLPPTFSDKDYWNNCYKDNVVILHSFLSWQCWKTRSKTCVELCYGSVTLYRRTGGIFKQSF